MIKNPPANAGDTRDAGSVFESGRSHVEGNGNSLQDSCLENSMDRGPWQATVHGVTRDGHNLVTKPSSPPPYIVYLGHPACFNLVQPSYTLAHL